MWSLSYLLSLLLRKAYTINVNSCIHGFIGLWRSTRERESAHGKEKLFFDYIWEYKSDGSWTEKTNCCLRIYSTRTKSLSGKEAFSRTRQTITSLNGIRKEKRSENAKNCIQLDFFLFLVFRSRSFNNNVRRQWQWKIFSNETIAKVKRNEREKILFSSFCHLWMFSNPYHSFAALVIFKLKWTENW